MAFLSFVRKYSLNAPEVWNDELLAKQAQYAELYELQAQYYTE